MSYWWFKTGGEFYKINDEFSEELVMGFDEFKGAKRKLVRLGFITTRRKVIPPKNILYIKDRCYHLCYSEAWKIHQTSGGKSTKYYKEYKQRKELYLL